MDESKSGLHICHGLEIISQALSKKTSFDSFHFLSNNNATTNVLPQ